MLFFKSRGVVVVTITQLHSTIPELRFSVGSNPALSVSEIRDGEDLWQWSRLEIRLNAFRWSTIPQKQFIIIIIIIIIITDPHFPPPFKNVIVFGYKIRVSTRKGHFERKFLIFNPLESLGTVWYIFQKPISWPTSLLNLEMT